MSMRHLEIIRRMLNGERGAVIPIKEVLMLPNHLEPASGYDPLAFGTPGGAPRMLGPDFPVIWDGRYVYIFVGLSDMPTYVKLEEK